MPQAIKTIEFTMQLGPIKMGTVNCYLAQTNSGYILIDTAYPSKRAELARELERAGCRPGDLKLVIITHADIDHIGAAVYLRKKYGARIAMHPREARAVESGDAGQSRRKRPFFERVIGAVIFEALALLVGFGRYERFSPDLCIEDGYDLREYGWDAKVLHLPGHSMGSIGILTGEGDLFCGDLLWNMNQPGRHSIVDDLAEMNASIEKLKGLGIRMIYPGHGKPFSMDLLLKNYQTV
jgi:glyoxylase-like metal-dependent hydrolase (beta-lactamase superfamily II)